MTGFGFVMLATVAVAALATGLPMWGILIGVASFAALIGMATGAVVPALLLILPGRLINLLESDILQALPLFVAMGALLNRLPLADRLYRAGLALMGGRPFAPGVCALALGVVLGPMNGSAGANAIALTRAIEPKLAASGVESARAISLLAVASTFGIVVPPSLVLILLGDAMLGAHTIALNVSNRAGQIINTQDVFRGALLPAALFVTAAMAVVVWQSRRMPQAAAAFAALTLAEGASAAATVVFIVTLLAGVALGFFYAVEAAAMGAVGLLAYGMLSGQLRIASLAQALDDTIATTGALFALLIAATSFTLVFRMFGTDKQVEAAIAAVPGGEYGVLLAGLAVIGLSAFVLDAFEIIFVMVPLVMPALLTRVADATWVAVLVLIVLQTSFLLPPFGYALILTRAVARQKPGGAAVARALRPFLLVQLAVVLAVLALPRLAHLGRGPAIDIVASPASEADMRERLKTGFPPPPDEPDVAAPKF